MKNFQKAVEVKGFEFVYRYPKGSPPVLNETEVAWKVQDGRDLRFDVTRAIPGKVIHHGHLYLTGWDIPIVWAIDEKGQCWKSNAHGDPLWKVEVKHFLNAAETEDERNHLRDLLGLKPELPDWIVQARRHGWTPPPEFDFSKWE